MKNVTKEIAEGLDDIAVYPTIGNHDTYPMDIIKAQEPRENDVINEWSPTWAQFIPDGKQLKSFLDYGYYSLPLKKKDGSLLGKGQIVKLISLNSNICYETNFETFAIFKDAGHQIQWLHNELLELEKVNGTAIILGHVPNLSECTRQYGRRFHALMDRFQHIVRWSVFSHIHAEQF